MNKHRITQLTFCIALSSLASAQDGETFVKLFSPRMEPLGLTAATLDQGTSLLSATGIGGELQFPDSDYGANGLLVVSPSTVAGGVSLGQSIPLTPVITDPGLAPETRVIDEHWMTIPAIYSTAIKSEDGALYGDDYSTWGLHPVDASSKYDFMAMVGTLNSNRVIEQFLEYKGAAIAGSESFERATLFRTRDNGFTNGSGAYLSTFLNGSAEHLTQGGIDLTIVHIAPNLQAFGTCTIGASYVTHGLATGAIHQIDGGLGIGDTLFIYSEGTGVVHGPIAVLQSISEQQASSTAPASSPPACQTCSGCDEPWSSGNVNCNWNLFGNGDNCQIFSAPFMTYSKRKNGCVEVSSKCWSASSVPATVAPLRAGSKYTLDTSMTFSIGPVGGVRYEVKVGESKEIYTEEVFDGTGTPGPGTDNCGQCQSWIRRTMVQVGIYSYWRNGIWRDLAPGCKRVRQKQKCIYVSPIEAVVCDKKNG